MSSGLKGPHALKILQATKAEAFQAFIDEKISFVDFEEWCSENCERWRIDEDRLKRWIIDAQQNQITEAKLERPNNAAKVANLMGATLKAALKVDVEALSAVKVKRLIDRNGKSVKDDDGKPIELETPDWEARHKAKESIFKILGAYAPERLEVLAGPLDEFAALTDEQLKREIAKYRTGSGVETPTGIDGAPGSDRLPLLASERDDNQGRAGRGESVQAIPIAAILSTDSRRTQ